MVAGQDVFTPTLDVGALNAVEAELCQHEQVRGAAHAGQLRAALRLDALYRAAGLGLNTVPHLALVLGCSELRAGTLLADAHTLAPLPGALEAVETGLLTVEQSRTLVSALDPLPVEQRVSVWERLRARLLELAEHDIVLPPARLGELLHRWTTSVDPAAATARRKTAEAGGKVDYRRREDSLYDLYLSGLNGPDAHACLTRIRAAAAGPDDGRSADRRRLDAARDLILGRYALPFTDDHDHGQAVDEHGESSARSCRGRSGCDCHPGQPVPCGAGLTVLVPLSAALGTTDELAELAGHGPLEPDLLSQLLLAAPELRAVFVDDDGTPVAVNDQVEHPVRDDPAAVRDALLRLAASEPGLWQPRHPDDHPPGPLTPPADPDPPDEDGPPGGTRPPQPRPPEPPPPSALSPPPPPASTGDSGGRRSPLRPAVLANPHPEGTAGAYRFGRRLQRLLRARAPRCEWPGCGARAVRCDLDHDLAWPEGPTCACNGGPACRRHHRVKQTGWTKLRRPGNTVLWISPTGRVWTSPSQHRPPEPAIRALPGLPVPDPLDELSPTHAEQERWHADPGHPMWHDPEAHELRTEDTEPGDTDPTDAHDTTWTWDLDDTWAWLAEPAR